MMIVPFARCCAVAWASAFRMSTSASAASRRQMVGSLAASVDWTSASWLWRVSDGCLAPAATVVSCSKESQDELDHRSRLIGEAT
jgi:hypothetical protein